MPKPVTTLLLLACLNSTSLTADDLPSSAREFQQRAEKHENAGRVDEAIADYRKAGELDPKLFDAHFSESSLWAEKQDYRKAVAALTRSLGARPRAYTALFNRGLYHEYLGDFDDAIADYTLASSADADFSYNVDSPEKCRAHAFHYRGRAYQWFHNDNEKAIEDFTQALLLDPKIRMVHYRRGVAHHAIQEYGRAHADFEEAVKTKPDYPNLLNAWAWQLATCPEEEFRDGARALQMATKTKHLETLAAACAETGEFAEAVAHQRKAIQQFDRTKKPKTPEKKDSRKKLRAKMEKRLATYEAGQPYREK